jgi:hypothetical protein
MGVIRAAGVGQRVGTRWRWSRRLAVIALVAVVGCTSEQPRTGTTTPDPPLHAPSATGSSTDPRAEVDAAVAAYTNLLNAFVAASNAGTDDTTEMSRYAAGGRVPEQHRGADRPAGARLPESAAVRNPVRVGVRSVRAGAPQRVLLLPR